MGFISDIEAMEIAKLIFSEDDYAAFDQARERMRHFEWCIATNTPSPDCIHTDQVKNLAWCRLGLDIEGAVFEDYVGQVIEHRERLKRATPAQRP
jgi:hypothetical protein